MSALNAMRWMMAQHTLRLIAALITALWLARVLGPSFYGDYQSSLSWILLFTAIAGGGLHAILIQSLATHPQPEKLLGSAWRMRWILTGLSLLLCILLPPLFAEKSLIGIILVMAPTLLWQNAELIEFLFLARSDPRPIAIARIAGLLTSASIFAWGLLHQQGVLFFATAFWTEHFVSGCILFYFNQKRGIPYSNWKPDPRIIAELAKQGWPVLLATFFYLASLRLDVLMLNIMADSQESGVYAAAARFSQLWIFLPSLMLNAWFPQFAQTRKNCPEEYPVQVSGLFALLSSTAWIIGIFLALSAYTLIPFLLGHAYIRTADLLHIQAWMIVFCFMSAGIDRWLIQEHLTPYILIFHALTAVTNFTLNLSWIPQWGALGATLASLCALLAGTLLYPWLFKPTRKLAAQIARSLIAPVFLLFSSSERQLLRQILRS